MKKPKRFHFLSFQIGVIVGVIIAFSLAAIAVKNSGWFLRTPSKASPMTTEGFNFRKIRESNNDWRGSRPGERINLSGLKNSDGKSLWIIAGKLYRFGQAQARKKTTARESAGKLSRILILSTIRWRL